MSVTKLRIDHRRRITLGKYLLENASSVSIVVEGNRIILEPLTEMPTHELWLLQNPEQLQRVQTALKETAVHDLGSFAQYSDEPV